MSQAWVELADLLETRRTYRVPLKNKEEFFRAFFGRPDPSSPGLVCVDVSFADDAEGQDSAIAVLVYQPERPGSPPSLAPVMPKESS
jgi:hypothetical protein